ncbi:MAG: flagellar biosynthetic protein FliO [Treponema sp.]|nr:flagellar biosynthetic protein FliO [Treponema sp.]
MGGEKLKHFYLAYAIFFIFFTTINVSVASSQDASQELVSPVSDGAQGAAMRNQEAERQLLIGEEAADSTIVAEPASVFTLLRILLVLALAAAAIYGLVFFLKRLSRPPQQKNPYLKVLARAPLNASSMVAVVSVGTRAWLVGAAEHSVSLLAEINDQELIDTMLLDESQKNAETGTNKFADFGAILRRARGAGPQTSVFSDLKAENVRKRRERLKEL